MRVSKAVLFRHILVWTIYITYELSLIEITIGMNAGLVHYMVFYLLNICLFYFNAHVILDYAFFKTNKPYLTAALLIVFEILAYLLLKLEIDSYLKGTRALDFSLTLEHEKLWLTNIFREIYFIGFSIAYWSMLYMMRFKEKNHTMEKEQLRAIAHSFELENKYIAAENAYLQNQISPHLLFNSLNFIYAAIHKLSEKAGKGVMLLSDIMRYSLVSSEDNRTVLLTDEAMHIEKLIELSHLRLEHQLFLKFSKAGKLKGVRILPLVLITLVENMVKHGDLGDARYPGRITLHYSEDRLVFKTRNRKRKSSPHPPGGIGLRNIEKRLSNFYPERYELAINDLTNDFTVILTLNLNL